MHVHEPWRDDLPAHIGDLACLRGIETRTHRRNRPLTDRDVQAPSVSATRIDHLAAAKQ